MRQSLVKLHPKTGLPLKPVGYVRGRAIMPILGAAEDDDDDSKDPDDDPEGGSGDDDSDDSERDEEKDKRDPRIKELSDENARRRNEAKQLKKDLEAAQARLKEIDDQDKSEVERLTEENTDLKTVNQGLEQDLREARIHNAFLAQNKYTWHEPDTALKLVDLSEVEIGEDGTVAGIDKALEALAKSKPYLVKGDGSDEEEGPKGPTGAPAGSGKRKSKTEVDREAMEKKYPALRR